MIVSSYKESSVSATAVAPEPAVAIPDHAKPKSAKRDSKLEDMTAMFDELLLTLPKAESTKPTSVAESNDVANGKEATRSLAPLTTSASQNSLGASSSIDITDFFNRESTEKEHPSALDAAAETRHHRESHHQQPDACTSCGAHSVQGTTTATPIKHTAHHPPPVHIVISDESGARPADSSMQSTPTTHLPSTSATSLQNRDIFETSFAAAAETSRSNLTVHAVPPSNPGLLPDSAACDGKPPKSERKKRPSLRKLLRPRRSGSSSSNVEKPGKKSDKQREKEMEKDTAGTASINEIPSNSTTETSTLEDLDSPAASPASPYPMLGLPQVRRRSHVYSQRRSVSHAGAVAENFPIDVDHLAGSADDDDSTHTTPFNIETVIFSTDNPHLDLSSRNLSHFPSLTAPRFLTLVELHIVNNWITAIPAAITATVPKLQVLDVSQNLLTRIPGELAALTDLREIYARENRLEVVPIEFSQCAKLEVCDLGRNRIADLAPSIFSGMSSLTTLDLSHNLLRILPSSIGLLASSLRSLYIHGNPFSNSFMNVAAPLLAAMELSRQQDHPGGLCASHTSKDDKTGIDEWGAVQHPQDHKPQDGEHPTEDAGVEGTPRSMRKRIQSLPSKQGGSWTSAHLRRFENMFSTAQQHQPSFPQQEQQQRPSSPTTKVKTPSGTWRSTRSFLIQLNGTTTSTSVTPRGSIRGLPGFIADGQPTEIVVCEGLFGGPTSIQDIFTEEPAPPDENDEAATAKVAEKTNEVTEQFAAVLDELQQQTVQSPLEMKEETAGPFGLKGRSKNTRKRPERASMPLLHGPYDSFLLSNNSQQSLYGPRTSSLELSRTGKAPSTRRRQRFSLFSNHKDAPPMTAPAPLSPHPHRETPARIHLKQLLNFLRDAHDLDPRTMNGSEVDILDCAGADQPDVEDLGTVSDEGKNAARLRKKRDNPERRGKVAVEILSTERTYVAQLEALMEVYIKPIEERGLLNAQELNSIFANVKSILLFHSEHFLPDLEARCGQPDQPMGAVFLASAPFLRMYSTYYNNFDSANSLVSQLESQAAASASAAPAASSGPQFGAGGGRKALGKRFRDFVQEAKQDPRHTQNSLQSFLILPVQRLPRYKLLVDELFECTPPEHVDYADLKRAREQVRLRVAECNEKKREWEARERGLHVLLRIRPKQWSSGVDMFKHVRPGRRFLREGVLRVLKVVEFVGAATGHPRIDALQACGGKKERFKQSVIGHLIETRFGDKGGDGPNAAHTAPGAGSPSSTVSSPPAHEDTKKKHAESESLTKLRLARIGGKPFHFFLFTDVLCWCRLKPGTEGEHDLIQGIGITPGDEGCVELTELDVPPTSAITSSSSTSLLPNNNNGKKAGNKKEGVLRIRNRESVVYIRGPWEDMVAWRDSVVSGQTNIM
ncbi:hypothetical protein DFJ77DRAFT_551934 [Powellomyces hirtus]|nr:hypothetical protein DFJ77DRAFT_551934 [Powellomyces hirtus]